MAKIKIHPSVTSDRIMEAVQRRHSTLDNPGIRVICGADADGCEPDARRYECEACGERGEKDDHADATDSDAF